MDKIVATYGDNLSFKDKLLGLMRASSGESGNRLIPSSSYMLQGAGGAAIGSTITSAIGNKLIKKHIINDNILKNIAKEHAGRPRLSMWAQKSAMRKGKMLAILSALTGSLSGGFLANKLYFKDRGINIKTPIVTPYRSEFSQEAIEKYIK